MATLPTARAIPLQQQSPEQAREEEHNGRLMFLDDRSPVTSSNVDSLLWDEDKNTVYVWFRYVPAGTEPENATTATMYVYNDVNPTDWFELITSVSQGIHMQNTFKNRYTGTRVGGRGAWPAIGTYRPDLTFAQAEARRRRP